MTYPTNSAPGVFVDHEALHNLRQQLETSGTRAALVGFGEYAKHLVNFHRDNVIAIYDPSSRYKGKGAQFRGVPIIDLPETVDANLVLGCEYHLNYDYLGSVIRKSGWPRYYYPPRIDHKPTHQIDVFAQEAIYHSVLRDMGEAPVSMMNPEKIKYLLELLRTGLNNSKSGSVLEMGSWQGGSAYFIAKAMKYLGEARPFYMMDLFEAHMMDPTATMCTDEIRLRMAEAYDHVTLVCGLVDDPACLEQVETPLCFAHIDLGCQETAVAFTWDNLVPGSPLLLDNYGHLAATTWRFDDMFAERGSRVIRLPWSEQGIVFKN